MSTTWYCCRQRAGPLVKECRALRPRFSPDDTDDDHSAKSRVKKYERCAVNRRQVDRLELHLALLGEHGTMYTLTFDADHLPQDFNGVRRALRSFFGRVRRWRAGMGKPPNIDYIYCIEGLHGARRYHVHLILRDDELCPTEVRFLWRNGIVDDEPVLHKKRVIDPQTGERVTVYADGYRRIAEYLNKERTDGHVIPIGRHPWSCSRTLSAKLPPALKWRDDSGVIPVPDSALWSRHGQYGNDFGAYYYASWIEPQPRATN